MKIAIVSHPRSGGTKLCKVIENIYSDRNMVNLSEIAQDNTPRHEKYLSIKTLNETKNCVVNLHSYIFDISPETVAWNDFDCVFFLSRTSIVDAYISDAIAIRRNNHVRDVDSGENNENFSLSINPPHIIRWVDEKIVTMQLIKDTILKYTNSKLIYLSYDDVMNDNTLLKILQQHDITIDKIPQISSIPSGINYKKQCINYTEVENKFKELGLYGK